MIIPGQTSCFQCTINQFPKQEIFQLCTLAETPRQPEHCIAYVSELLWDQVYPDRKLDADVVVDVMWVFEKARERAEQFKIEGVTYK